MTSRLKISARLPNAKKSQVFELNNINLKRNVEELKKEVSQKINIEQNKYELCYCGLVLEDDATMESFGLKSGVTVHLIIKKDNVNVPDSNQNSDATITRLASIFMSLSENDSFRNAFQRFISRDDFNENLIEAIPTLKSDLVSVAMVNDPILMLQFTDTETIKRAFKNHPTLVQVAQHIAAAIQEEAMKSPATSTSPVASSSSMNFLPGVSFDMDSSGDFEDMDVSQSSEPSTPQTSATPPVLPNLRNVRQRGHDGDAVSSPPRILHISTEMFSMAIQQAVASTQANSTSAPVTPGTPMSPLTPQPQSQNMQTQLNIMHDMGLTDDAINIQALHFTNGDVQAAIELVFSGFGDN